MGSFGLHFSRDCASGATTGRSNRSPPLPPAANNGTGGSKDSGGRSRTAALTQDISKESSRSVAVKSEVLGRSAMSKMDQETAEGAASTSKSGVVTSQSGIQKSHKVSRGENQKQSFLPAPCFLGRRLNESRPVYRPGQTKPRSRFSLRNLLYSNPLQSPPFSNSPSRSRKQKETDTQSEGSWVERMSQGTTSSTQHNHNLNQNPISNLNEMGVRECSLCLAECTPDQFPPLRNCSHLSCIFCLQQYVRIEIQEGRANLKCPQCNQLIHPNDIAELVGEDTALLNLYQFLMVRRVLAADPDTRWCPAPNCSYAVVATGCASCPKIDCEREGCDFSFCYHCKAEWHPNITCDKARAQRHPIRSGSQDSGMGGGLEIKVCPRCSVLIVKMDDGSCNHMTCAVCGSEFCWLCMKEISDLHYLSPSGCTFWGKKPWSRKKKLLWQLGTIVGAPVGIALIAGISVPAMVIGIPVWVGRKINSRHLFSSKPKRVSCIAAGVISSVLVSPVLAGLAVSIGVPILLAYVYGVVPLSLCRSGGCGVRTTTQGVRLDVDEEVPYRKVNHQQGEPGQGSASGRVANPSIGELSLGASLSMGSGSHLDRLVECDRESASNTAIAGYSLTGSVASSYLGQHRLEVGADVHPRKKFSFSSERLSETVSLSEKSATVSLADDGGASTRALAGSILQYRMENSSVNSYRTGQATPGSNGSAGTVPEPDGVSYKQHGNDTDSQTFSTYPSADEISLRSMPGGQRSLSPVTTATGATGTAGAIATANIGLSGEEVTAALRRSNRRRLLEKQQSEASSAEEQSRATSVDQELCDRVRFDSHISFMDASKAELEQDRNRLMLKKGELETETLREETAEELALVVSPITAHRGGLSPLSGCGSASSPPPLIVSPLDDAGLTTPSGTNNSPTVTCAEPLLPLSPTMSTNSSYRLESPPHEGSAVGLTQPIKTRPDRPGDPWLCPTELSPMLPSSPNFSMGKDQLQHQSTVSTISIGGSEHTTETAASANVSLVRIEGVTSGAGGGRSNLTSPVTVTKITDNVHNTIDTPAASASATLSISIPASKPSLTSSTSVEEDQ